MRERISAVAEERGLSVSAFVRLAVVRLLRAKKRARCPALLLIGPRARRTIAETPTFRDTSK